jgi:hypothetical protein
MGINPNKRDRYNKYVIIGCVFIQTKYKHLVVKMEVICYFITSSNQPNSKFLSATIPSLVLI